MMQSSAKNATSASTHHDLLPRCDEKIKRLNLKGKRKRNLIKKAIELSQMLDMDMLIVFRDIDTGKMTLYNSGE